MADAENLPFVFTEQGIAMLSAVLRSDVTIQTSINIMDAGKKCFGINLIQNIGIIKDILQRLELEAEE